jgi:hypothetical protein
MRSGTGPAGTFGTAHKGEVVVAMSISGTAAAREKPQLGARSVTTSQDLVTRFDPFVPTSVERMFQN